MWMRAIVHSLLLASAGRACAQRPDSAVIIRGGGVVICDTLGMRPRQSARIPDVAPPASLYGAIVGSVFRSDSRHGVDSAIVYLTRPGDPANEVFRSQVTGPTGGFAFDSLAPASYRITAGAAWHRKAILSHVVTAGKLDTVGFPMERPGFCGRP
jgi:hypothetical protein